MGSALATICWRAAPAPISEGSIVLAEHDGTVTQVWAEACTFCTPSRIVNSITACIGSSISRKH